MAKYLYFDGTGGRLQLPSMTFTEIVLDMSAIRTTDAIKIYVDARSGIGFCYLQSDTNGTDSWSSFNNVYVDGVNKSNNTAMIPNNQRCSVRLVRGTGTDDLTLFSNNSGGNAFVKGNLYNVKIYNGTTLQAHYDMTTSTVQDQSGNGNHATLTGGTWLDDGTGGTPTGEDGSALFSLSQKIYSDENILTSTNQKIYSDANAIYSTNQTVYQDDSLSYLSNQSIYSDDSLNIDSKQILYEDSFVPFATLQEIFNDGQIGSVIYPLLLQIYSDEISNLTTTQSMYESGTNQYNTNQAIYENNQLQNLTKQIIYSDSYTQYDSTQKIYSDASSGYITNQSIYEINSFALNTLQQLFEHSSMDLQTKQFIYQLDTVELLTLQSIYEDNSISMDTLQQFLSDYVEYRQVFKYLLAINMQSNFDLGIVGNQKFGVDISDRVIKYDLNVSDQVKKYDLNI